MNRLSLRNNRLKFKTAGKLPIKFRGIYEKKINFSQQIYNVFMKNHVVTMCSTLCRKGKGNVDFKHQYECEYAGLTITMVDHDAR